MRLEAFREALLADARGDARRHRDAADRDVQQRLAAAAQGADDARGRATREGRDAAELETRRRRAEARRRARAEVLGARREALDDLRRLVLDRLGDRRDTPAYTTMLDRLERAARHRLDDAARIDRHPDGGGLVAHADGRSIDYRLPTLVDLALAEMGEGVEELWR